MLFRSQEEAKKHIERLEKEVNRLKTVQVQQLSSTGGNATHPTSLGSFHLFEARERKTGFSVRFQLYLKNLNEEISSVYTGNVFHFDDWQSTFISETLTSSFVTSSSERWP